MDNTSLDVLEDLLPWSENPRRNAGKRSDYDSRGSGWSPDYRSAPSGRMFQRVKAPNPPDSGKNIQPAAEAGKTCFRRDVGMGKCTTGSAAVCLGQGTELR